jgi:hypothetical protein
LPAEALAAALTAVQMDQVVVAVEAPADLLAELLHHILVVVAVAQLMLQWAAAATVVQESS